jgi:ATP-dependent RNA helicase SUPV3L1/SUV3
LSATAPQPEITPAAITEDKAAAAEPEFEEIWRPRRRREHGHSEERRNKHRRHRSRQGGGEHRPGEAPRDQVATPDKERHPKRHRHHGNRGKPHPHRDDTRQPAARTSTAGNQKRGGVDPDSPFAALSALKLALEKRAQDPSAS